MKSQDLPALNNMLLAEGIANTYEYPGYINLEYRKHNVTIGIDGDTLVIQVTTIGGKGVKLPDQFAFKVNNTTSISDILPRIKKLLYLAYIAVDENVWQNPDVLQ